MPEIVDKMLEITDKNSNKRFIASTLLQDMLKDCCQPSGKDKLLFMTHLIMSDVEEIFEDPFGTVHPKSVPVGSGAEQGFKMLKNNGDINGPGTIVEAFQMIIKYMQESATTDDLDMTGYKHLDENETVYNKVNGRPFNATDAENFLCKLWVVSKYTLPANCIVRQPNATKPHCHPVHLRGKEFPPNDLIEKIMTGIIRGHEETMEDQETLSFCLLPDEIAEMNYTYKGNLE